MLRPLLLLLLPLLPARSFAQADADWSLDPVAGRVAAARAAYAAGALGDAHDHLASALELAPDEPDVRLWLGRVLNDLGRGEAALEVLGPALTALPRSAWLLTERGRAELALGRVDAAERAFRSALDAYPRLGTARLQLTEVLLRCDPARAQEALDLLQPLVESQPRHAAVILRRAEILTRLGRDAEAEAGLRAAAPEHADVQLALCRWLAERRRFDEAWAVGEPLTAVLRDTTARTLLAQVARRAGRPLECLELLGAVLLEDPTQESALAELGELLEEVGDLDARVVARRLAARPDDVDAWRELLESDLRDGRIDELLVRVGEIPPQLMADPRLALLHGQALRRKGRGAEARALLEPLCTAGDARACYEVGLLDYAEARFEEAAVRFRRGAHGAWAADAHYNRGICLDRLGRYDEAGKAYEAATAARPEFPEAWLLLGHDRRLRLGQPELARDAYRRYLEQGGDDAEVRRFVGER